MGEVIYIITGRNRLTVSMQKKTGIYIQYKAFCIILITLCMQNDIFTLYTCTCTTVQLQVV